MRSTRRTLAVIAVALALVIGSACTGPAPTEESVGEALGDGIGWLLTIALAELACAVNPSCEHPICALFPCSPSPNAVAEAPDPGATDPEPVAPG